MTDIYNNVGRLILAECKANRVTYKYACVKGNKIKPRYEFNRVPTVDSIINYHKNRGLSRILGRIKIRPVDKPNE